MNICDEERFGRGTSAGRLGDGGGEKRRWLKLNREEVADRGPEMRSWLLYDIARRRLILGGAIMTLACVGEERSRRGAMMSTRWRQQDGCRKNRNINLKENRNQ